MEADYVEKTLKPWLIAGGYAAILHYLMFEVDLAKPVLNGRAFNPFGAAPETAARKAMIEAGREDVDVWLDFITDETDKECTTFPNTNFKLATAEELFANFCGSYPKSHMRYKTFVSCLRRAVPMVRGGNVVPLGPGNGAKRLYCPPMRFQEYSRLSAETLLEAYNFGKE